MQLSNPFRRYTPKLLAAAATAALLTACAGKPAIPEPRDGVAATVPLVGTYKVSRFSLDNGLKLLVVEDHSSPTFALNVWYRVGSRDENPGYTGLAHLFEHMMFKETKNLKEGEFDKILEAAGVEGENAFTSRDYTAYIQELPKDKLDLIASMEAERMVNLVINEQAFKTETEVVQNERRFRNENNPDGLMYQELFETAFTQHPYHWPVIGYQEDLNRMSAKEAVEFYRTYYSPNHATVIVVGDLEPNQVLQTVKKHFGGISGQPSPAKTIAAEIPQISARHKTLKLNIKTEKLMMGYRIPEVTHEDIPALAFIQTTLAGGKSSRLHRALVETGIATTVEAYAMDDKDPSLFIVSANLQKGRKAAHAEQIVLKELARLGLQPVSKQELEKTRNIISFDFYQGLDSNSSKARFLGHYESVAGSFQAGLDIYRRTLQITPLEVQAAVKRYFEPKNRTVITGVPK